MFDFSPQYINTIVIFVNEGVVKHSSPICTTAFNMVLTIYKFKSFHAINYLLIIQALPLLAMMEPVDPGQLLQFINSFNPKGTAEEADTSESMETEHEFLTYDKMSDDQRLLVDEVQEEHEDFTDLLAVQAVNELKETASLGMCLSMLCVYVDCLCDVTEVHVDVIVLVDYIIVLPGGLKTFIMPCSASKII